jgi:large subunit ribosomal protein L17
MHRHGYKGRKFGRERDQRRALTKGLVDALVIYESIETTLPKAKELVSYTEKLVTKAKKGDIHNRRQIISSMATKEAAHKLVDELAPKLAGRNSGYFRIEKTKVRRGDNTQMAKVSFVDDLSERPKAAKPKAESPKPKDEKPAAKAEPKTTAKKPATRTRKPAAAKESK